MTFQVGEKVRVINTYDNSTLKIGDVGTVKGVRIGCIDVEFPFAIEDGHSCHNNCCKNGYGWQFSDSCLEPYIEIGDKSIESKELTDTLLKRDYSHIARDVISWMDFDTFLVPQIKIRFLDTKNNVNIWLYKFIKADWVCVDKKLNIVN